MKKIMIFLAVLLCAGAVIVAPAAAKEKTKKTAKPAAEDSVPLVTEVMTKEELQAYLKEKGIPIITKENFKEPELVWERTFDEPIREISDITEKGNSIARGGAASGTDPDSSLLFIDRKGSVRKRLSLGKVTEDNIEYFVTATVAKSGRYAAVFRVAVQEQDERTTLTYYDEEGKPLWSKPLAEAHTSIMSYSGDTIAIAAGNPVWDEAEWSAGNKNVDTVRFYDNEGRLLSEYGGYRNFSQWALSDDGKYFAAFAWWMDEKDRETGKLIYFDVRQGKVLWSKQLPNVHWMAIGGPNSLAISEKGSYVAAALIKPGEKIAEWWTAKKEIKVFDNQGTAILRVPGKEVSRVREDAFLSGGSLKKGWIDLTKFQATGLFGYPPYFFKLVDLEAVDEKTNDRFAKTHRILSKEGEVLWERDLMRGRYNFTSDWRFLVGVQYIDKDHKKIEVYKLFINRKQ